MVKKIGLMVGREWSFPPAFVAEVNSRKGGVVAEYVKIGTPGSTDRVEYDVIVDRISHAIPFYRSYLKRAARQGVKVINDPVALASHDRFAAAAIAADMGVRTPATALLPHRSYAPEIVPEESLRNLDYPLDWQALANRIGMPCVLRDAAIDAEEQWVCTSLDELLEHYNRSDRKLLIAQEKIEWEHYVRCFVFGREDALPLKFDPIERKYQVHHAHLTDTLGDRIVHDSLELTRALGLDINAVDWGIRDGVAYVVRVLNPIPDLDIYALGAHYFEQVVERLADMAIRLATGEGKPPEVTRLRSDGDGAGDLAEELPSLAQGLPRPKL
jgi:hypothetical protein